MSYENVFTPRKIGKLQLKNRLMIAPMATEMGDVEGYVSEKQLNYYEARARGGFGLVLVEIVAPQKVGRAAPFELSIYDDKFIPGFAELAKRIKKHDACAMLQLHHGGRQTMSAIAGEQPVAPSVIPCPALREMPRELTTEEVYQLANDFAQGAVRAKKAGFDGVEIHFGHGYLLAQFLSPRANKRIDEFGGSAEGRSLIAKLIVEGIKRECGDDFAVTARVSSVEGNPGGYTENMAIIYAKLLESYGYDAFHITAGSYGEMDLIMPPYDKQPGWNLESAKKIKAAINIPVITVGRYTDPTLINYVLENNYSDFIALGRQSICDPDFPNKMKEGKLEEIIPCLSCSHRCTDYYNQKYAEIGDVGMSCVINPFSADRPELRAELVPAETPKNVMVVGSGPAGLEAAWVAAKRGHKVTLYEKKPKNQAGGQFLIASYPPFKQTIAQAISYYLCQCEKYGVKMVFGQEVDETFIKSKNPDVLFIATGGKPIAPNIPGMDKIAACQANDVLTGTFGPAAISGNVLIVGGGQVGVETAEFCIPYCNKITVLEMMPELAPGMFAAAKDSLLERFRKGGKVDTHTNTKVLRFTENGAVCECNGKEVLFEGYNSVILAMGSRAYNPFAECNGLAKEVYTIGDAVSVRSAVEAFFEGAKYATKI